MTRRRTKRLLIWVVVLVLLLVPVFGTYRYLAITAPSGAHTVAVEGWIPDELMPTVKAEIDRRGYTTVYTTGTVRPFSYYLKNGEAIDIVLSTPVQGEVTLNVSGIGGAWFMLVTGIDTLMTTHVSGEARGFSTRLSEPVDHLRLISTSSYVPPALLDNIFVKYLRIDGVNVHRIARSVEFIHTDSTRAPAWPTYAHASAAHLERLGVEGERIIIAPALDPTMSRTLANAEGFALRAQQDHVRQVDVLSLGVHARRSRKLYQQACGEEVDVGVIALLDPAAAPGEWWKNPRGWYTVIKEMALVPLSSFLEVERTGEEP